MKYRYLTGEETFKVFPPIQKPNPCTIDDAIAMMKDATGSAGE